jgi:DNA-binding FrmR family transcriptional regulator
MRISTATLDVQARNELAARLKSIEGQARGICDMLDDGRDCQAIMDQLAALRAASHAASMRALEAFTRHCLASSSDPPEQVLSQMMSVVARLTR